MKEPKRPFPPFAPDYDSKIERKYIYSYSATLLEDYDEEEEEEREVPKKPINEVDLAWLVDEVPKGVTLDQIKIEFGYNANCMSYEDHYVKFYYEVEIP